MSVQIRWYQYLANILRFNFSHDPFFPLKEIHRNKNVISYCVIRGKSDICYLFGNSKDILHNFLTIPLSYVSCRLQWKISVLFLCMLWNLSNREGVLNRKKQEIFHLSVKKWFLAQNDHNNRYETLRKRWWKQNLIQSIVTMFALCIMMSIYLFFFCLYMHFTALCNFNEHVVFFIYLFWHIVKCPTKFNKNWSILYPDYI